jgi:microsomal dipeptidase-like Zn-dependent dipeptidase
MGAAAIADAIRAARGAGMTALVLSAVADFAVLRPDPATGLRAQRNFRAGEAYADYQRQLTGIREAAAEAGAEVATSAADLERAARDGRTAVLLGCEGGDFLEGDLRRLEWPARPASPCSPWCTTGSARSATCRPRTRCTTA